MRSTATIYQNETEVLIIFSQDKKDKNYRGSTTSFENNWSDGGACGISGFENKKELDKFLKENKLVKKGVIKLGDYCRDKHQRKDGGTNTCELKPNHKGKHEAKYEKKIYRWKN